ncbi:oxidoreductase NADbinding domain containing protein [Acanthamoeba castellanii str. Neff]|uniref:NADH-cytochrome b5 reductase n=1 Tax=Acanthamoeba castellanii (strain ATCC 30010 / Neff) TaxID=1257118 RepID=L8GS96_ACACF|nr:oxidoreductase NADbinding domain containing protein [Acanthamoeba castellanii str. Neff]ELR15870.1 oxidoreductase NADbinding domain containing protein [Acanthamoeba castellanii str. Neff]
MRRIASTNTRSFARASTFTSTTLSSSSSSAASLSLPLHRRFASSEDNKQQKQDDQQSSGSGFLTTLVVAAAFAAGGYHWYKEVVGEPFEERKKVAPVAAVAQEGKKEAEAAEVKPLPPVSLNKDEFREFELVEVEDLTPNTRRLRFALPSRDHVLGLPVASCVVTKANIGENGKPVIRPYTPVTNDKSDKGYFDFVIKDYPTGVMSSHIYHLKKGEKLQVKGPIPKLAYSKNMKKHLGMLAGGTGITPMLQVLEEVLSEDDDKTHVSLVFANNTEQDIILKDRLDALAKKHPNRLEVHYVVAQPADAASWKGHTGFINADIIKKHIPGPAEDVMVYVCGPPPFYKALSGSKAPDYSQGELDGVLKDLGYIKEQVFKF